MTTEPKPWELGQYPKNPYLYKYYYDIKEVVRHCTRCNSCKYIDSWELKSARFARVCPSAAYYLFDGYSCQGRMDIALAMIDGRLKYEDSPKLLDVWYKCNTCGGCDVSCKRIRDAEPLRTFLDIRAQLVEDGQLVPEHMMIIDNLRKEDNMMMGRKADRGKWAEGLEVKDLTKEKADVVFHAGCLIDYDPDLWETARTSIKLLQNAGVDVGILGKDETCCATRQYDFGYRGESVKYAENNIEAWKNAGVKTVVTSCSNGYWAFKRLYPEVGSKFKVMHVAEFVSRLIKERKIKFTKTIPMTVTYHDPCHLGRLGEPYIPWEGIERKIRGQIVVYDPPRPRYNGANGVYDPPREVLRSIPGLELVEMERIREYAWCCGGGTREAYPDFSVWTARERIEEARCTGAEAIVSACPWCQRNFIDAISANGENMKAYDIIELVQQAI